MVGEADRLVVPPDGCYAIVEVDIRAAASEFAHLERPRGLVGHIQSLAVAVWHRKHPVVFPGIDGLDEILVELDDSNSIHELRGTEIFEPVFRRLDAGHRHFALAAVERNHGTNSTVAMELGVLID